MISCVGIPIYFLQHSHFANKFEFEKVRLKSRNRGSGLEFAKGFHIVVSIM